MSYIATMSSLPLNLGASCALAINLPVPPAEQYYFAGATIVYTLGALAVYCINHKSSYYSLEKEKAAREKANPQYFTDKSPLEVFFEK